MLQIIYFYLVFLVIITFPYRITRSENMTTEMDEMVVDSRSGVIKTMLITPSNETVSEGTKGFRNMTLLESSQTKPLVFQAFPLMNVKDSGNTSEFSELINKDNLEMRQDGTGNVGIIRTFASTIPTVTNNATELLLHGNALINQATVRTREEMENRIQQRTLEKFPTNNTRRILQSGAIYEKTDGVPKPCRLHVDCYEMREPRAWCDLKVGESWTGEGCFCDHNIGTCIVELRRFGKLYYTDCLWMTSWYCSPNEIVAN